MTPTTDLLRQGFAWTAARIAAVPADGLDNPTPCSLFDLRELLDHLIGSLTTLVDAAAPPPAEPAPDVSPLGPTPWDRAIAELAARSARAWTTPGAMDRMVEIPLGRIPAPVAAQITLLETVVHGWDIGRASGEAADIPDELAVPILDFARQAITDATRVDRFAADLGNDVGRGDTPSDRLVAYLGRKPQ